MKKGSHQTEEAKQKISKKMSEINKGENNPMFGRTGELHHNFGKHWDEETRKKMGRKGRTSPFKGKKHTKDAIKSNSDKHKGKVTSEETRRKISIQSTIHHSAKCSYGKGQWYIRLDGSEIWLRSSYEVRVAKRLDKLSIEWIYEPKYFDLGNRFYCPDFLINNSIWWEVKGWMQEEDKCKLIKFSNMYPEENIKIIYINDIEQLESLNENFTNDQITNLGIDIKCI